MKFFKNKTSEGGKKGWLKKVGLIGFLFFFIKGLVWIGVAVWAWWTMKN